MSDASNVPRGRTRWRRFGIAFIPAMGLVVTTMVLMAVGVLALPITVSGQTFTVSASSLTIPAGSQGPGAFQQYANVDPTTGGIPVAVATTVLTAGTLNDLDQVVCGPTGLPGPLSHLKVEIKANPAEATGGLVVDSTSQSGTATFSNLQIGVPVTNPRTGLPTFALTADNLTITGLNQTAVYTQAGTFKLTGLSLAASFTGSC